MQQESHASCSLNLVRIGRHQTRRVKIITEPRAIFSRISNLWLRLFMWDISRVMSVAFFEFPSSVLIRITDEKNAGGCMGATCCGLMYCVLGFSD